MMCTSVHACAFVVDIGLDSKHYSHATGSAEYQCRCVVCNVVC